MFIFVPRAAVSAGRIQEVLETEPSIRDPEHAGPLRAGRPPSAASSSSATSSSATRAPRSRSCTTSRSGPRPARPPRSSAAPAAASRRSSTSSRASTTRRRARSSSTASTSARWTARTSGRGSGSIPQKAFLFSGTVASNLRFGDENATDDELWHALEIAQGATSSRRWRAASRRRSPRAARTSRAASASASRSPGRSSKTRRDLHLRRQLLGARLRDRRAAARRARARARPGDRDHRRPARRHDHEGRPDPGHGRRPDRRQRHAQPSCSRPTRPTARSSTRSCPKRRPWHERATRAAARHGPAAGGTRRRPGARHDRRSRRTGRRGGPGPVATGGRGGPGMMGMGMGLPPQKSKNFRGSFRRLLGRLRPGAAADRARHRPRHRQRRLRGHRPEDPGQRDQRHLRGRPSASSCRPA